MCTKLKPQLHSEVLSSCGSSLVRVDVHDVAVARVLGMSDSAKSFEFIIVLWLEFGDHRKLDIFIKHMQNRVSCFQAGVVLSACALSTCTVFLVHQTRATATFRSSK